MPRPKKCRRICSMPQVKGFIPVNDEGCNDKVILSFDEYEAVRLIDLEKLSQEQCAKQMNVARTTITAIYDEAREKIADALVNGRKLLIEGGNVSVCEHSERCCKRRCWKECSTASEGQCSKDCCR